MALEEDYSPGFGRRMIQDMLRDALGEPVPDAGPIRNEIQQGLGEQAAEYGTKGLGHLGDILDIPGAFVRGVVGAGLSAVQGEFGNAGKRLLSAIPGSEEIPKALGLGAGFRAPTGSDLLSDVGVGIGNTMDEERRIRVAMASGLSRAEASRRFTTRYEEDTLSEAQQADFSNILQQALAIDPDLKTGVTFDDIKRATDATDFLGFAAEIALDPLTYFTMGASAAGKASKLVRAAEIAARLEHGPGEVGKAAGRAIVDSFKGAKSFDEAAQIAQGVNLSDAGKGKLVDALREAWKDGAPDIDLGTGVLDQIRRGQFRAGFKLPGMDEPMLQDGATKALDLVGNAVVGIGKGAMRFRPVAEFVTKHPGLAMAPKKFWLRLSGEARKADTLGNDALTEIYLHEQHFNKQAGYEALKYQADLKQGVARILNDLNDAEKAEVLKAAPTLVENAVYRNFARSGLMETGASSKKVNDALLDYADFLRLKDDELFAMQQKWGLGVHELVEDFQHLGRQLRPEILDVFAKSPDARKAWLGTKTRMERNAMHSAILDLEKGRKLRGMGWEESEAHMREALKPFGIADDAPIWDDAVSTMLRRSDKSLEAAKIRNLTHVAAEVYGRTPDGAVDLARGVVREAVQATTNDATRRATIAQEMLADAQRMQGEFREGREALRSVAPKPVSVPRKITDALDLVDPATTPQAAQLARTLNPNNRAQVDEFRRVLAEELGSRPGVAGRQAEELGRAAGRAQEARLVTAETQQGSRIAYQAGRDAQQRAVPIAEALRDEAKELVSLTPGAADARKALSEARKALAGAKKQEDLQQAATAIARAIGAKTPEGGDDVVAAAEELVRYTKQHIKDNPAIKDADASLRAANKMLADARQVASRVETFTLQAHINDLAASAEAAHSTSGIGAKYITTAMRNELRKAKQTIDEVAEHYRKQDDISAIKLENAEQARMGQGVDIGPELKAKRAALAESKRKSIRDVRAALSTMRSELRKDAPAALLRVFERAERQASKVANAVGDAQGAVAKPVAQAVNQRVRDAQKQAELAQEILSKSDVSTWSPEAKAQYVMRSLEKAGLAPNPGEMSALELMLKAKVKLSDDLEDLASAGVKYLDAHDGDEFMRYATNHYWQHLDSPGKVRQVWRAIKGIYQRSTLARVASLTRDLVGTSTQGMIAGSHGEMQGAMKALGSLDDWRNGVNQADDVLRLKAAGVLKTTKGEALEGRGMLAGVPLLGNVEESGVIGGTLRSLGGDKAGKAVGEKIGVLNEARQYWEEAWRVATYRKALKDGLSEEDAVQRVFRHFGKFDETTKTERNISDAMLFWSWMARSIPVAAYNLVAHPVKSRLALQLVAGNVTSSDSQPEWMRRMGGWMLGQGENGNAMVINLGNSTYFSPAMSALQSDFVKELSRGNLGRAGGEVMREVARSAPPIATGLYERLAEKESFTNESWWADPQNRIGSRLKAPAGFYWLKDTPLGSLMGLRVTSEPTQAGPMIKTVTMDPEVANILSFIPGLEPMMTDASSLMDPRKSTGEFSLGKGLARTAGVPVYETPATDENTRDVRRFRNALAQSIDKLPGKSLTRTGANVHPDTQTERGREIRVAMDKLYKDARSRTLDERSARAYMYDQLSMIYPEESRWLKLNDQLRMFAKIADAPEEARLKSLVR